MIEVTIRIAADEDNPLGATEQAVLAALTGNTASDAPAAPVESAAAPEAAPAPKAPRKPRQTRSTRAAVLEDTPEEQPEPPATEEEPEEQEEDLVGGDEAATLDDAISLATAAVSDGKTAKVKAALKKAGAAKVRELEGDQIQVFVDEMNK